MEQIAPSPQEKIIQKVSEALPELTDQEKEEALQVAREAKRDAIERKKYWDKITSEPQYRSYNAAELKNFLEHSRTATGKPFKIDNDNEELINRLCLYFAKDPRFNEIPGMSLDKGIALLGNVGVGKSHLMTFFMQNQHQSYVMMNCRQIEGRWCDEASLGKDRPRVGVIDRYSHFLQGSVNSNYFGHEELGICFDDLGTETSPSKSYGEEKHVLAEIIMNRYENKLPYNYTHFTVNLNPKEIEQKYGTRVRDRMREMCNQIFFHKDAKSRR